MEQRIAWIASGQQGNATRRQLLAAGISVDEIRGRVRRGSLIPEFPGVYRVGHRAPNTKSHYLAAVLACGDGACLCGRAAGYLLRLLRNEPPPPEVMAPTERRVSGINTRRARRLHPRDRTIVDQIPVTTVPRTLVDLAAVLTEDELGPACHEAAVVYRVTPRRVEAVLRRRPNAPGAKKLRAVLTGKSRIALSELERTFLRLLGDAGLPLPQTNKVKGTFRIDCRWPDDGLTVELDSYRFHNTRQAWERDRRREREARARGDDFRRFTHGDVLDRPATVVAELAAFFPGRGQRAR